jgi:hypothetical protein
MKKMEITHVAAHTRVIMGKLAISTYKTRKGNQLNQHIQNSNRLAALQNAYLLPYTTRRHPLPLPTEAVFSATPPAHGLAARGRRSNNHRCQ